MMPGVSRDGSMWLLTMDLVAVRILDNNADSVEDNAVDGAGNPSEWDVTDAWGKPGLPDEYAPFFRVNPSMYGLGAPYSKPRVMPSARHRDENDHADNADA